MRERADVDLIGSAGTIHLDLPYVNKVGVTSQLRIRRAGANRSATRPAITTVRPLAVGVRSIPAELYRGWGQSC